MKAWRVFVRSLARAFVVWLLILIAESISGTIRRIWLVPALGELKSHQIGVVTASALILLIAWLTAHWLNARTFKTQLQTGVLWVVLMLSFEFGVGWAIGNSMPQMLAEYDLTRGGLMGLGFLVLLFAPALGAKASNAHKPSLGKLIMQMRRGSSLLSTLLVFVAIVFVAIWWRFDSDIIVARAHAAQGGVIVPTRCGPIEYQEAGSGVPLLMVHGSGGGHDQGMTFAGNLAQHGIRVIAMSRFGYLRTPMPADASPAAQADAHVCLLDALGIARAAVLGGSAGGPSALQMAIRHPDRVSALVLLVPLAYKPNALADSAKPLAPWAEALLMRLIGSDFLFWVGLHVARDQVIRYVLATPPELVHGASAQEQQRINTMLDHILPVSERAAGLRSDSVMGKKLEPSDLTKVRAPTLIVSARDDGFGTFASAEYTAGQINGATFVGFEQGGHVWVGHDDEVMAEIVKLFVPPVQLIQSVRP